jgi:hypothetical protein
VSRATGLRSRADGWLAAGRAHARRSGALRYLVRRRRAARWLTDWRGVRGGDVPPASEEPVKVLFGTDVGGYLNGTIPEAALAAALTLRGHDVHMLLCDGVLPACMECTYVQIDDDDMVAKGPQGSLCNFCHATGTRSVAGLDVTLHRFSENLSPQDRAEARALAAASVVETVADLEVDGLRLGEHALAGTLRFFARATLDGEPQALPILRRYVEAAVITARVAQSLLRRERFDVVVFHHGIYVPQGILGEVCRAEGVRVVNWNPAYRSRSFIFSHGDTYHHTLMDEPTEVWESQGWDDAREAELMTYLRSRWEGTEDWIWFHERPQTDITAIEAELGVDFGAKPTIGLLTNVMWDAQLHYPANAFPTMRDWVLETVEWFAAHPELQLVVRVHPAEITGWLPSRQLVVDELRHSLPSLPPNVFLAGPESHVSTYQAMLACDSVIIFGTKTGVELTSLGVPVIVAGEAWIRGKGVTTDISSREQYFRVLADLPVGRRMDPDLVRRAKQYAYHFFFGRMIPLEFMEPSGVDIPVYRAAVPDVAALAPGASRGLDVIVEGIVRGTPFVYRPEHAAASPG